MHILLFGGFLGSGKTTTILQVARQITEARQETVAIIENEIGDAGVDDKLFQGSGIQVRPLFGGCVCCQITSDLVTAVNEIYQTINPDWLVVEMTGLAIPGNIVELVNKYCSAFATFKTVTIVDGGRWTELKEVLEPLVVAQVEKSDLVIVNKSDIAGPDLKTTVADIKALVGQVPVLTASATVPLSLTLLKEVFQIE
ncbi:G3E family GTPase [Sporomusaceae bacterium BoRhaA]|uniref:GTP-binding protein n=1 Tax=Pelorhabdus rhamnosifermentans TaxID=2772457 RepID=UPI001C062D77|nr:GTP-binding protein [Pelorhabdus rhamnosifermentans]MBU2700971.1 G3E family GTPase [Pelorhabdus rhamnosifermentans]